MARALRLLVLSSCAIASRAGGDELRTWESPHALVRLEGPEADVRKAERCRAAIEAAGATPFTTVPVQAVLLLAADGNRLTIAIAQGLVLDEPRPHLEIEALCRDALAELQRYLDASGRAGAIRAAEARYQLGFLGLAGFGDGIDDREWRAFQGMQGRRLDHVQFYRLLGRDDLAASYQQRGAVRATIIYGGAIVGGVLTLSGLIATLWRSCIYENSWGCETYAPWGTPYNRVGAGLLAVGIPMALALPLGGYFGMRADPVSRAEARAMADEYNRRLRSAKGEADDPGSRAPAPPSPFITLAPFASPAGGGLSLAGRW